MKNSKDLKYAGYIKIIVFILTFVLLLEVLSLTAFSKEKAALYSNNLANAYSFKAEPENSIQLAGIGNSDLYSGFVPTTLWQKFGYTSTLIAAPRQTPLQSYEMLTELLKTQHPDLIMLEVDMLYSSPPGNKSNIKTDETLDMMFDFFDTANFQNAVESHFTIFSFHDRWKIIGEKKKFAVKTPNSHGYKYNSTKRKITVRDYMVESEGYEPISKINIDYVDKFVKLCQQEDIDVMLVVLPTANSWNYERHNAVQRLAESYGIDFVDLNLCLEEMDLDFETDFRDKGNHLNYEGANKATNYLGDYIKNNYSLDDRSGNPDFDYWNDSCAAFADEMAEEDKKASKDDE